MRAQKIKIRFEVQYLNLGHKPLRKSSYIFNNMTQCNRKMTQCNRVASDLNSLKRWILRLKNSR